MSGSGALKRLLRPRTISSAPIVALMTRSTIEAAPPALKLSITPPTIRRARTGLLASFPPFVLLLQRLFVSPLPRRTCTADVTHEGRDSRNQVDLPEQPFGHR